MYFNAVLGLFFIIGLIFLCAYVARKFNLAQTLAKRPDMRVKVLFRTNIDARNKIVLVRKDDTEHLLMVGPSHSLLIESSPVKTQEEKLHE